MRRHSIRGIILVLALFVLGGLLLCGLFLAPHSISPPAPADVPFAAPARKLRFVSYNILHAQRGLDQVAAEIKALAPDFALVQEIESRDAVDLALALSMEKFHHPNLYQRSANLDGPRSSWGNCIFSKHPIFDAESIPNPGGGSFGVWAVAVVDGSKFVVADVHLSATWNANPSHIKNSGENRYGELKNFVDAWHARGSPPIVVGGDFNQIPMGNNYALMTRELTDALGALGETGITFGEGFLRTRIDYFLLSQEWKPDAGGIAETKTSDHRAIWLEASGKSDAPTTAASSRPN